MTLFKSLVLAALATSVQATSKRGISYANATWANYFAGTQVSWAYNWGFPSNGLASQIEFVPMLWGVPNGPDPTWTTAAEAAKAILTFNEPDLGSQANIIPSVAAAGYEMYVQPLAGKVNISGPAVTNGGAGQLGYIGLGWMDAFNSVCTGCHQDFQAIHWYDNATAQSFKDYMTLAYQRAGKPIWITEFMLQDSDANQITFLENVMPWMDAQPWIQRYAYFGAFETFMINAAGSGLSPIGKTFATYTG